MASLVVGVVTGLIGLLAGILTTYLKTKGELQRVREESAARLAELEKVRGYTVEDRDAQAAQAASAERANQRSTLLRAAMDLEAALARPDTMKYNVLQAEDAVREATADIPSDSSLGPHVDALLDASSRRDLEAVRLVLHQLPS